MDISNLNLKIVIVGLGLIGGSYAKALKKVKPISISAIEMQEEVIAKAIKMGIIDTGHKTGEKLLKEADLVIMALYPEDTIKFIEKNTNNFKSGAIVTDTCGIKMNLVQRITKLLPQDVDFIGGHPMAGKEAKGINQACEKIFIGANYILTPMESNKACNVELVAQIAKAIGCKNVLSVTPTQHDEMISLTSHLPHLIAVSLMNTKTSEEKIGLFTGGSFMDATRVAQINCNLWSELFSLNSDNLLKEIEKFEESMNELKKAIRAEDRNALKDLLLSASLKRERLI